MHIQGLPKGWVTTHHAWPCSHSVMQNLLKQIEGKISNFKLD